MPFRSKIIHVRWSGEAVWIPLGDREFGVGFEDATSHPAPGEIILYPGGVSETEILLAYGPTCFASKAGQLAGNRFITITEKLDKIGSKSLASLDSNILNVLKVMIRLTFFIFFKCFGTISSATICLNSR